MTSHRGMFLIAGIVCAVSVSAARPAYAPASPDPCTLLTPEQVSGALKVAVGKGDPIGTTGCAWATPTEHQPYVRATLSLVDGSGFASMKTPLPGVKQTPAPGVGNDAFYVTVGSLTTLSVKSGSAAFVIRVYGIQDPAEQMQMEKALALEVIAKL